MSPHHTARFHTSPLKPTAAAALMLLAMCAHSPTWSAPLNLANVPAGNGGREPAPNIIISVDDSGSMGSAGMTALRNALNNAFSNTAVADDSIRLGFQAMWRCRGFGSPVSNYGGTCPENRVRPFSGTHRTGFNNWVNSLTHNSMTPSHLMIKNAGEFMKTTGVWNPYAKNPGVEELPLLSCRKSFQIFMTDGEWNSASSYGNDPGTAGNADGTLRTLPDGTTYDPYYTTLTAPTGLRQFDVYRDTHGAGTVNTLADFVFDYWSTDLQPTIPNEVRPIIKQPGAVNFGTVADPKLLQEYWNPRNNPATWQSLTTYTIGFGSGAALSTGTAPRWGGTTGTTWSGGDYNNLVLGTVNWGDPNSSSDAKRKELWHMAINGRGRYVSANNAAELSSAFAEIVNQILADSSSPLVSIAASSQSVRTDTKAFVAGYDAARWSGHVRAYNLTNNQSLNQTVVWDAAVQLNALTPANRLIYTHDGTDPATFAWDNLSTLQQDLLKGSDAATVGQARLDYLRGERSAEQNNGGTFRTRDNRLGNIVNSSIWTVGKPVAGYSEASYRSFRTSRASRTPMVYVGANDGMLHGFSANTGDELMAYVPLGAYASLSQLTMPSYQHRYFVDGSPFTGDFYNGTAWRTALVGTMAGGGRGFFVLDVTNPADWTSSSAASVVVMDKTASFTASSSVGLPAATWADVGHIYGEPTLDQDNPARAAQITRLNNNRWAAVMGNGVNSDNEQATLLIQYLDGAKELVKLVADATTGAGNGLAHPRLIDLNGDDKADIAYAGDLKGNVWKFNLTSATPSNWSVAFSGDPLFVARDTAGTRQPITTTPTWILHPNGGTMLAFGTGREMTETDRTDTALQTLYAIWDNTKFTATASGVTLLDGPSDGASKIADTAPLYGRTQLVQQTQTLTTTISGQTYFKTSANPVPYTGANAKRGWYLDWPSLAERTVKNGGILNKSLMYMRSRKPAVGSLTAATEETCTPDATPVEEYLTLVDIFSGQPTASPVFDTNKDGVFNASDESGVSRWKAGRDDRMWLKRGRPDGLNNEVLNLGPRENDTMRINTGAIAPGRVGWRQLQ